MIGFVLALGIPSMTVGMAIMIPIAWALVQLLACRRRAAGPLPSLSGRGSPRRPHRYKADANFAHSETEPTTSPATFFV